MLKWINHPPVGGQATDDLLDNPPVGEQAPPVVGHASLVSSTCPPRVLVSDQINKVITNPLSDAIAVLGPTSISFKAL